MLSTRKRFLHFGFSDQNSLRVSHLPLTYFIYRLIPLDCINLTELDEEYKLYSSLLYLVFTILPFTPVSWAQIFSSVPCY
jgi:hypothetical protein